MRENVRAQLRVIVKRILRKYSYPVDKQEKATQTMLEQVAPFAREGGAMHYSRIFSEPGDHRCREYLFRMPTPMKG